ncbi:VP2 [Bluetongue virus]|uniref:Outer capsid protein VP2 n=1 Tax=Bluetongue virus TaxID=40051 RepID=A0A0E3Z9P6_BTV|nr:VP2 [Bluetongue virus]
MEDFPVGVIERDSTTVPAVVKRYPIIVDVSTMTALSGGKNDVPRLTGLRIVGVKQESVRTGLKYRPDADTNIVLPRNLDVLIRAYDHKHQLSRDKKPTRYDIDSVSEGDISTWVSNRTDEFYDLQPIYHTVDEAIGKVKFSSLLGSVMTESNYAESMSYHYVGIERDKCDHSRWHRFFPMLLSDSLNVSKEVGYVLKETYKIKAIGEAQEGQRQELSVGLPYTPGIRRNERISDMKQPVYKRFVEGYIRCQIEPNIPDKLADLKTQLDAICDAWYGGRTPIVADEICRITSRIGRLMWNTEEEPVDETMRSRVFQESLRLMFRAENNEYRNIQAIQSGRTPRQKFYATLIIAATDSFRWRIWWNNPYPCLRGCLIACEMELGDVYKSLKSIYKWSLRPGYSPPREIERQNNVYPYQKINLFEFPSDPGTQIIHWRITHKPTPDELNYEDGYPCPESGEYDITMAIDEGLYTAFKRKIIERGWEREALKLDELIPPEKNIFNMEFEKDAHLDNRNHLVMPPYYDKTVYCPLFHAVARVTTTEISHRHNDDPWSDRTLYGFKGDHVMTHYTGLNHIISRRKPLTGETLSIKQDMGSYVKHILGEEWSETCCVGSVYSKELPKMLFLDIYDSLVKHVPKAQLKDHSDYYQDARERLSDITDWDTFVVFMIYTCFEKRNQVPREEEATQKVKAIREAGKDKRMKLIRKIFPSFYQQMIKLNDVKRWEDAYAFNFLPLLLCVGANIQYEHRQWSYPVLILTERGPRVVPAMIGRNLADGNLGDWHAYIKFYMGKRAEELDVEEDHQEILRVTYRHYMSHNYVSNVKDVAVRMTKEIMLDLYFASGCSGVSEMLTFLLPVVHPRKGLVIFCVADDLTRPQVQCEAALRRFPNTREYIHDVVVIQVSRPGTLGQVWRRNNSKVKICRRNFLRYDHKVVLSRLCGLVYGNYELMTKLTNI